MPVTKPDVIESIVCESVRLGEEAFNIRRVELNSNISSEEYEVLLQKAKALEADSDRLWKLAKELGKENVSDTNYEDLANAFLLRCIEDYELLISGAQESPTINIPLIESILSEQQFVSINMKDQLDHINAVYKERFVPYAEKNAKAIIEQWRDFEKKGVSIDDRIRLSKHRCPLCGGSLKPKKFRNMDGCVIACTNCKLYY